MGHQLTGIEEKSSSQAVTSKRSRLFQAGTFVQTQSPRLMEATMRKSLTKNLISYPAGEELFFLFFQPLDYFPVAVGYFFVIQFFNGGSYRRV